MYLLVNISLYMKPVSRSNKFAKADMMGVSSVILIIVICMVNADASETPTTCTTPSPCTNAANTAVSVRQSSVSLNGNPERAVDGNTDGDFGDNSCSCTEIESEPWWYADLCRQVTVYGVMLTNLNLKPSYLSMIDVAVTNAVPPQNFPTSDVAVRRITTFEGTIKLKFNLPKTGRYLVIKLRKHDYLILCEVQWVTSAAELTGDFINGDVTVVAVRQSSGGLKGNPERAVDGNTDGEYSHNSCSRTSLDNEPWWYVEFDTQVTIFGVMITNVKNLEEKLGLMEVAVTNFDPPQNFSTSDLAVRRITTFHGTIKLKFQSPKSGRYLVIKLRKEEELILCEVQWVTSAAALTDDFIDGDITIVSVHQSSVAFSGSPERAVDGNTDGEFWHYFCSCTSLDDQPWWYVEFSTNVRIYGVMISNRNMLQERLTQFEVAVTNTIPPQNYTTSDVGVRRWRPFNDTLKMRFKSPKTGRYLVIKLGKRDYLSLCEVQWVTSAADLTDDFVDSDSIIVSVHQSSVRYDRRPELAVDENTDGYCKTCSLTYFDLVPWWYIEFDTQITIFGVLICKVYSNANFEVAVTNTQPPPNYGATDVGVKGWRIFDGTTKLKFKSPKTGKYLVIKIIDPDSMSLCEVQWVTSAAELTDDFIGDEGIVSVHQSSVQWGGNPEKAIDANILTDDEESADVCSFTKYEDQPWWYLEFDQELTIYGVTLYCENATQSSLYQFDVAVTNTYPPQDYSRQDVAVYRDKLVDFILRLRFVQPKSGRYLVVRLHVKDYLVLCEVLWVTRAADLTDDFVYDDPIPAK